MKTNSILILALVLIVVIVLFNNNKQESFNVLDPRNLTNIIQENINNDLKVLLILSEDCDDCKRYIESGDEVIRSELGIPNNVIIEKVVYKVDTESYDLFKIFGIVNVPAAVIKHADTGFYKISDVSSHSIAQAIDNVLNEVRVLTRKITNITQEDINNGFEVLLFLSENCEDCKRYIESGDEKIRSELGIPDNIRIRKEVYQVYPDSDNLFQIYGIVNVPAAIIRHPKTGFYKISDVSRDAIKEAIDYTYEQIMQKYVYNNNLS